MSKAAGGESSRCQPTCTRSLAMPVQQMRVGDRSSHQSAASHRSNILFVVIKSGTSNACLSGSNLHR
ncbi:hypothetical protein ACLOJK_012810 [Asimina triloba]